MNEFRWYGNQVLPTVDRMFLKFDIGNNSGTDATCLVDWNYVTEEVIL